MTYRTHILGGTATLWALAFLPHGMDLAGLSAGAAILGSLLPDLDARGSKLQSLSIKGIQPFVPVARMVAASSPHRGPLHSIFATYAVAGLLGMPIAGYLGWQVGVALVLGYLSHVLLDACTMRGVRLMWPSQRTYWLLPRGWRVSTDKHAEDIPFMACGFAAAGLLISLLLNGTLALGAA